MGNQCRATPSDPYHVNLCMLSYIMTKRGPVRVVCFRSIENKVDDYLAAHIPEEVMSHEEIAEA
jgi:hypothetical protein